MQAPDDPANEGLGLPSIEPNPVSTADTRFTTGAQTRAAARREAAINDDCMTGVRVSGVQCAVLGHEGPVPQRFFNRFRRPDEIFVREGGAGITRGGH